MYWIFRSLWLKFSGRLPLFSVTSAVIFPLTGRCRLRFTAHIKYELTITWVTSSLLNFKSSDRSRQFQQSSSSAVGHAAPAADSIRRRWSLRPTLKKVPVSTTDGEDVIRCSRRRVLPGSLSVWARRGVAPGAESSGRLAPRRGNAGRSRWTPSRSRRSWERPRGRGSPAGPGISRGASGRRRSARCHPQSPWRRSSAGFPSSWWSCARACTTRGTATAACHTARWYTPAGPTHPHPGITDIRWRAQRGYSPDSTCLSAGRSESRGSLPGRGRTGTVCTCKYADVRSSSTRSQSPAQHSK